MAGWARGSSPGSRARTAHKNWESTVGVRANPEPAPQARQAAGERAGARWGGRWGRREGRTAHPGHCSPGPVAPPGSLGQGPSDPISGEVWRGPPFLPLPRALNLSASP